MKKFFMISFMIILVTALILSGCAAPTPPASKPAPTPTPTPAPKTEPIVLKYSDQNPETAFELSVCQKKLWPRVEAATKGRVKIEAYYNQTLTKGADTWEATKAGICDIGWLFQGYWPGVTPLSEVISLPFLPFTNSQHGAVVYWKLREKFPEIQAEYSPFKVLVSWTSYPYFINTSKKQVKTMGDLAGLKIRSIGGPPVESLKALGGVPVMIGAPDIYTSVEKGVVDGSGIEWSLTDAFKLYEQLKYYTYVPLYIGFFNIAMNLNKWKSLPPDIQEQIMSECGSKGTQLWGQARDLTEKAVKDKIAAGRHEIIEYTPPPNELEKWMEVGGKPLWETWVADMVKKGYPEAKVREILNTTLELIKTNKP